jgi:hypothetical protein
VGNPHLRIVVAVGAHEADLAVAGGEAVVVLPGLAVDPVRLLPDRRRAPAAVVRAGLVAVLGPAAAVPATAVVRAALVAVLGPAAPVRSAADAVVWPLATDLVPDVDDVAVPAGAAGAVGWRGRAVALLSAAVARGRRVTAVGIPTRAVRGGGRDPAVGVVRGRAAVGVRLAIAAAGLRRRAAALVVVIVAAVAVVVVVVRELHDCRAGERNGRIDRSD